MVCQSAEPAQDKILDSMIRTHLFNSQATFWVANGPAFFWINFWVSLCVILIDCQSLRVFNSVSLKNCFIQEAGLTGEQGEPARKNLVLQTFCKVLEYAIYPTEQWTAVPTTTWAAQCAPHCLSMVEAVFSSHLSEIMKLQKPGADRTIGEDILLHAIPEAFHKLVRLMPNEFLDLHSNPTLQAYIHPSTPELTIQLLAKLAADQNYWEFCCDTINSLTISCSRFLPNPIAVSANCVFRFGQAITSGADPAQVMSTEDFQQMEFVAKFFAMTVDAGGNSGHFDFALNALVEAVSNAVDGLAQFHKSAIWMGMIRRLNSVADLLKCTGIPEVSLFQLIKTRTAFALLSIAENLCLAIAVVSDDTDKAGNSEQS